MIGKALRLRRLRHPWSGRVFAVPMDHGLSTWPVEGLGDIAAAVDRVVRPGVTAVVLHSGFVHSARAALEREPGAGLIVHLSGSTGLGTNEHDMRIVCSVRHALSLGADAVSVQVNLGVPEEPAMLERLARVGEQCDRWGMPLLAMMYVKGGPRHGWETTAHAVRAGAELGADIVKTEYTGSPATFARVVQSVTIPVVIGGGPKSGSDADLLEMVHGSLASGASGVCIGRNLFARPAADPMISTIARLLHTADVSCATAG